MSNLKKELALRFLLVSIITTMINNRNHLCSNHPIINSITYPHALPNIENASFDGYLTFDNVEAAASDFGNIYHLMPSAVLHPKSVLDISTMIKSVFNMGLKSQLTVAARGHGHSLQGQAQAYRGVVIGMESLRSEMSFRTGKHPYVDVSGGELWIDILHESLKLGLTPKSWTDYLHHTVGGTLSNAGISGQAFRYGPQINNVQQLQVVTGQLALQDYVLTLTC